MAINTSSRRDGPSASTTPTRKAAASRSSPLPPTTSQRAHPPTLQRLHSGTEAASTLRTSAIAAMSTTRSLTSLSSASTSLHPILPRRTLKIVLIGDAGSGKTSIRHRFLSSTFFPSYRATIGADFITKTLPVDPLQPEGEKATLQIWDTAGQERFQSLGSAFYRGADAVIIAFDASEGGGGEEEVVREKVEKWWKVFMEKAPGPEGEEERKRFAWICAANKCDLLDGDAEVEREGVWKVLDGLVGRSEGQRDWGRDEEEQQERPSGAEEPVDPKEVLSRPDPNGLEAEQTPSSSEPAQSNDKGHPTPKYQKNLSNGRNGQAAGGRGESDTDDSTADPNGGTVKTVYATPYNTLTQTQRLTASPTPKSSANSSRRNDAKSTGGEAAGSGFLSSWMRSKSKATGASSSNVAGGGRGHQKRQSIKSIEVFQISDQEESDVSDGSTLEAKSSRYAFPTTAGRKKGKALQETPPRSFAKGSSHGTDRRRVDSTMSLNAPSVYHTPRGSTFFSVSPSARTTLGNPSSSSFRAKDDDDDDDDGDDGGSVKRLSVASNAPELKHKPSIASSSLSASTIKPPPPPPLLNRTLRPPKSINDIFTPHSPPTSPLSPPPPLTPSTISIPIEPSAPPAAPVDMDHPETGFTLFYTSAKTGHNIDRMFEHILHRILTNTAYTEATSAAAAETEQQRTQRQTAEAEVIRRTIRLASGKRDERWFGCC
ncbi:GTP-binding protein [Pseudozyma hubeiensis SY62]|uniref:GTP-binding protein n=1 Tax=Pseudozyma hubeiensis (strain SY62) TaxID=1305764 RepID=R9P2Y7_PSEHS|nr:GTP-binding protein [Pseudozyma hubeiensis SY62]GAC92460.1 GTP-binding protein [Pseudozyma hubeiensis SY62]